MASKRSRVRFSLAPHAFALGGEGDGLVPSLAADPASSATEAAAALPARAIVAWPVAAHIGDNLRIWAERLAGITLGATPIVASYDENALAEARGYRAIGLPGALWTLRRSTRDWLEAVAAAPADLLMLHPERGTIDLAEIARSNAHDAVHHVWDVERSLRPTE
jgi:hypothetical protein